MLKAKARPDSRNEVSYLWGYTARMWCRFLFPRGSTSSATCPTPRITPSLPIVSARVSVWWLDSPPHRCCLWQSILRRSFDSWQGGFGGRRHGAAPVLVCSGRLSCGFVVRNPPLCAPIGREDTARPEQRGVWGRQSCEDRGSWQLAAMGGNWAMMRACRRGVTRMRVCARSDALMKLQPAACC